MQPKAVLIAATLLAAFSVAGCFGDSQPLENNNNAPDAKVEASKDTSWTGESVEFDASQSADSDGEITRWHFDFGDGTKMEYKDEEEARDVSHAYKNGGEFVVTLTVTDDGGQQEGAKTDTATADVTVNEREKIVAEVAHADEANASQVERQEIPFQAYDGVDSFEIEVTGESNMPAGGSEIVITVFNPNGEELAKDSMTIDPMANETLSMNGVMSDKGTHKVEVKAESGAATVHGEIRMYYDATSMATDSEG